MRLILAAAMVASVLAVPVSADAHRLSLSRAVNVSSSALDNYAEARRRPEEIVTDVNVRPGDCTRFSAHRFECVGTFDYELLPGYEYVDGTTFMYCVASVSVRYTSARSRRLRTRVYDPRCF